MNFHERTALITSIITDFLRQYQRPTHLDDEGCLREIAAIAEEVNALIPTSLTREGFRDRIERALKQVRRTYTMRAWPMPAHFIKAMDATVERSKAVQADTSTGKTPMQIAADRINAGEAVGDTWLFGRSAVELLRSGLVTTAQIKAYRSAMYFAAKDLGGEAHAGAIEANLLQRHADAAANF